MGSLDDRASSCVGDQFVLHAFSSMECSTVLHLTQETDELWLSTVRACSPFAILPAICHHTRHLPPVVSTV